MAFSYYGSKHSLASKYQPPDHDIIVEPFAGSAGYSMFWLKQRPSLRAVIVEKCHEVAEAWRWLKTHTKEDVLNYPIPKAGERTEDFFIIMSSASSHACNFESRKKTGPFKVTERMSKCIPSMMKRIASHMEVMDRIEIIEGDYTNSPDIEATWFIDPPYQVTGTQENGDGYAKGCQARNLDFSALGSWCRSRKGQTIVCEKIGADWLPFRPFRTQVNTVYKKYTEVVWTSRPDEQMDMFGLDQNEA